MAAAHLIIIQRGALFFEFISQILINLLQQRYLQNLAIGSS